MQEEMATKQINKSGKSDRLTWVWHFQIESIQAGLEDGLCDTYDIGSNGIPKLQ